MSELLGNPVDSAFVQGQLLMSKAPQAYQAYEAALTWMDALALLSLVPFLFFLKPFLELIPSILSCAFRWRECVNLENNVKLSRSRNLAVLTLILPFLLVIFKYKIYSPAYFKLLSPGLQFLILIAVVILYIILAWAFVKFMAPDSSRKKNFIIACRSAYTFFILLVLLLLVATAVFDVFNITEKFAQITIYWILVLTYFLYLVRKLQIFYASFPLFTAILYLCALEIIPTGAVIASAIIF